MTSRKYRTSSTSIRLFSKESQVVLDQIDFNKNIAEQLDNINPSSIVVNAESTQKRILRELKLRFLEIEGFLGRIDFEKLTDSDKRALLLYAICKSQPLIVDLSLMVLQDKMRNLDFELSNYEIEQFIYQKAEEHAELDKISPKYKSEMASRIKRLFNEVGILENGKLQTLEVSSTFINYIVKDGEAWFLDVLFINDLDKHP